MPERYDQGEALQRVRQIMSRVSRIDVSELAPEVLIREELGIDSLMAMEIVATCELELGVRIDETELYKVQSVGDFESLVLRLMGGESHPHA